MASGWFTSLPSKGNIRKIVRYLTLVFLTGLIGSARLQTGGTPGALHPIPDEYRVVCDTLLIQEGDVILRRGWALASDLIARFFGHSSGMSHCGIVVHHQSRWQVIHTISGLISDQDGIRITPLTDFIREAAGHQITVKRLRADFDSLAVRSHSFRYLQMEIPFDHAFDLENNSRLYCTELIREVFIAAGLPDFFHYDSFAGKPILDFSTFFDQTLFLTVIQTEQKERRQ